MNNWKEYNLNGVKMTLYLNTKRHVWEVYLGDNIYNREPRMTITKAKGQAVIDFLELLKEGKS